MPRVLIVDDEPSIRELLVRIVEAEGLEAIEAEDGSVALELVRAQTPDVILLDNIMPMLDGLEFLKVLRADSGLKEVPVIMVSIQGEPRHQYAATKLGVVDYIPKPWMPGEIELRLKWALKAGSTVPAVPWELSGAVSAALEARQKLKSGEKKRGESEPQTEQWSSLDLPPNSATDIITPEEGGWLETKDGRIRVTVPAGAVRRAMAVSASPVDADAEPNPASLRVRLGNKATDLTFSDRTGAPVEGIRLNRPMEIAIALDPEATEGAADVSDLKIQEMDNRTREWSDLPTRVNKKTGIAKVRKLAFPPPEDHRKDVTILVISDDKSQQAELVDDLDSAGYQMLIESNPDNITATMIDARPDLVILDLGMRRLGGLNILRQLKGDSQTRQATVITLGDAINVDGGDTSRGEYAQSIALGARDMITKPWHPGDLQARVARAVDAAQARKHQAERAAKRVKSRLQAKRRKAARPARKRSTATQ